MQSASISLQEWKCGNYVIVETQIPFYSNISDRDTSISVNDPDGDDIADGPDNDIPVRLLPGEIDADNIFVNGRPGSICGQVRTDDGNPIANVLIYLHLDTNGDGNADGAPIDSVLTDGDSGDYCFLDIEPRDYVVVESQPLNYFDVTDYDHSTGPFDPDGVDTTLVLADNDVPVTLAPGEEDNDNRLH